MDIEQILTEEDTPHYTELRPMLWGSFNLSHTSIPFFQAVLTLEEAAKELKLVENLPSDLRSKWKLEELFQREIDWERVKHSIVDGYLRRPEKLKFFNSLTVALLPVDERKMLATKYGDTPRVPELKETLQKAPWQVTNAGGVQIITNKISPVGYLRWDPKRIFPATIDGQHRLAALQTLVNDGNLPTDALETKLSIIFLVLDPRVGFDISKMNLAQDENPVLTVVREVFIDLNKHAEEVARSRRILLDDQEIECRCLRQLMAQRMGETPEDRLPLGIVHWQHKDSTALAIHMMRKRVPEMEYIFCDTDKELPETYEYLEKIEYTLGIKITRLRDDRGFDHWLEVYGGYLPSSNMRANPLSPRIEATVAGSPSR